MSDLVPIITLPEADQLRWMNFCLQGEAHMQKAKNAELMAQSLVSILQERLTGGAADLYEPRVVEGQLQFHLKPQDSPLGSNSVTDLMAQTQ